MIFLLAAILSAALTMILFKLFIKYDIDYFQAIIINYAFAFGMGLYNSPSEFSLAQIVNSNWLFVALPLGVLFFSSLLLYALSTKAAGVALTTIATRITLIAPVTASFLFLGEQASFGRVAAIVMVVASMPLIFVDKKDDGKINMKSLLPLLGVFLGKAAIDLSLKLSQYFLIDSQSEYSLFVGTIFLSALVFGLAVLAINGKLFKMKIRLKHIVAGIILGFVNYYLSYATLRALDSIDASIVYPAMCTGTVLLTTFSGVYIFGEKLSRTKILGIVIAAAALVLLTV